MAQILTRRQLEKISNENIILTFLAMRKNILLQQNDLFQQNKVIKKNFQVKWPSQETNQKFIKKVTKDL